MICKLLLITAFLAVAACSSSDSNQDLKDFIAENKRRPPGKIEEAPKIEPYESFQYDAYRLRSPFDRPVSAIATDELPASSDVEPDSARQKERLEQFDLSTLYMVGTLSKDGALWALVSDPEGSIERVKTGDYMGRNHGRVTDISLNKIDLLEIVASGNGWLERPNVLELQVSDTK